MDARLVPGFGAVIRGLGEAAFTLVLLSSAGSIALASDSDNSPPVALAVTPCSLARPDSITQALVCSNEAEARQRLEKLACYSGDAPQVLGVRDVWRGRASLEAGAAAQNSLILAYVAHCLVTANLGLRPVEPAEPSAALYLRQALEDPSDFVVLVAMTGLIPILTPDELAKFVGIAVKRPTLAVPTVNLLSAQCDAGANAGVKSIRTAYAGSSKGLEIDHELAQMGELCDAAGHPIHPEFKGQVAPLPLGNGPPIAPTSDQSKCGH